MVPRQVKAFPLVISYSRIHLTKEVLREIVLTGSTQEIGQKGSEKSKQVFLLCFYTIYILCLLPWGRMSFL